MKTTFNVYFKDQILFSTAPVTETLIETVRLQLTKKFTNENNFHITKVETSETKSSVTINN